MKQAGKERTYKTPPNPEDKKLFEEFIGFYAPLKQLAENSQVKYRAGTAQILGWLRKAGGNLQNLKEKHVLSIIKELQNSSWKEATREDYWLRFCVFMKWLDRKHGIKDKDARELLLGDDKYRYKRDKNKEQRKNILTPEEVLHLVYTEPSLHYKAFYAVLYESGMRSGEALSLQKRDVKPGKNGGYILHLRKSKTEKRPIPLFNYSTKYLSRWLKQHPGSDDSLLFLNQVGEPLTNFAARKHLRHLLKVAKINIPRVTLHSFRHSRATELAGTGINEFEMCKFFGWRMGSDMPRTYIREQNIDVERSLRRAYGLEEEKRPLLAGKYCFSCEAPNSLDAEECDICGFPLSRERFDKVKKNVDSLKTEDLVKKLLREKHKELITEMRTELNKETVKE
ncbi:phage integrase family protein [Candidatus Woesearchaeota archaeon]|nr:phage integrase family protein [Candidatus Woesearchaeota archaeon]